MGSHSFAPLRSQSAHREARHGLQPASVKRNRRDAMQGQAQATSTLRAAVGGGPGARRVETTVAMRAREEIHWCLLVGARSGPKSRSPASDRDRPIHERPKVSEQATGGPSPHDSEASWAGALRPLAIRVSRLELPCVGGRAFKPGLCEDPRAEGPLSPKRWFPAAGVIALLWMGRPSGS